MLQCQLFYVDVLCLLTLPSLEYQGTYSSVTKYGHSCHLEVPEKELAVAPEVGILSGSRDLPGLAANKDRVMKLLDYYSPPAAISPQPQCLHYFWPLVPPAQSASESGLPPAAVMNKFALEMGTGLY